MLKIKKKKNTAKILLVDDEKILRKILKEALEHEGFKIFEAQNGEEGLKIAKQEQPDLILLDFVMPKVNGLEALKKLRQDKKTMTTPVILLTQLEYDERINQAMRFGACGFLVKANVEIKDIVKKIKQTLVI